MPQTGKLIPIKSLAILPEIEAQPTQPVLYHYTRRIGLLGMLERKEIWASNAKYLNDARELATARSVAEHMLTNHDFSEGSLEARFCGDAKIALTGVIDTFADVFVFSLSESDDLLSQWRAYGRAGDGYAVGFYVSALSSIAQEQDGYLSKCRYDSTSHLSLMKTVFTDAINTLHKDTGKGIDDFEARSRAIGVFIAGFQLVAPIIKHEKFAEEREWRLLFPFFNVWNPKVKFRDGGKVLVPYLPVPLGSQDSVVAQLRVGPTPHQELEIRAISGLLTNSGFRSAQVLLSEVPFRDW